MFGCVVSRSRAAVATFFSCPHSALMIFSRIGVASRPEQLGRAGKDLVRRVQLAVVGEPGIRFGTHFGARP
ncbi:MAG: hypothetical protein IPG77_19255 [Betaproteobacteria bacterium]|nr:hypothetical protein [Betaproteobacteria bacterium]